MTGENTPWTTAWPIAPPKGLPPSPWARIPDGGVSPFANEPGYVGPFAASQARGETIPTKGAHVRRSPEPTRLAPVSAASPAVSMATLQHVLGNMAEQIGQELGKRDAKIKRLEHSFEQDESIRRRPQMRWLGQWSRTRSVYDIANLVEHGGSTWYCTASTNSEPGTGDDWNLIAAAGKDGTKDAKGLELRMAALEHSTQQKMLEHSTVIADQAEDIAARIRWLKRLEARDDPRT